MIKIISRDLLYFFVAVTCTLNFSGCYIKKGFVPNETWQMDEQKKQQYKTVPANVNLKVDLLHEWDGGEVKEGMMFDAQVKNFKKVSTQVFKESHFFQNAEYDLNPSDFTLEFHVRETEKGTLGMAILCGISMMLIPGKTGAVFEVTALVKDKNGKTLGMYTSKGDFDYIMELLFILWPFGWKLSLPNQVYEAILFDILNQMDANRSKWLPESMFMTQA